ncbi:cadmium resistance transporter (plasmid) [Nicoliella spurrieriana]|uniref:Cadmium resistance transporter n=1 Tax=Nicoliella spurrieriana TaxID=2925830 RepID=A0A976RQI4_9LACO|nr:cadmium resistance transporter [Nicoliella spurrieriana]UQS85960.1 cadmium resistance transporter [Nicoliella spurrieriana]
MINAILTGITAYLSTGIDYILILMTVLTFYQTTKERLKVYLGDVLGTICLVSISLMFSISARLIPEKWVLGLLGIIPIMIGAYILFKLNSEDEQEQVVKRLSKNNLILSVTIITITTCGADNIGIYVPIFAQVNHWGELVVILMTFFAMLNLFFVLAICFVKIPVIETLLQKYGDIFTAIVYIGIGIFIMVESDTITKLIQFIS